MWECPTCHISLKDTSKCCPTCGFPKIEPSANYCINPECERYERPVSEKQYYCDKCKKPTKIGKKIEELT